MGGGGEKTNETFSVSTTQPHYGSLPNSSIQNAGPNPEMAGAVAVATMEHEDPDYWHGNDADDLVEDPASYYNDYTDDEDPFDDDGEIGNPADDLINANPDLYYKAANAIHDAGIVPSGIAGVGVGTSGGPVVVGFSKDAPDITGATNLIAGQPITALQADLGKKHDAAIDVLAESWEAIRTDPDLTVAEKYDKLSQIAESWRDELDVMALNSDLSKEQTVLQAARLRATTAGYLDSLPVSSLQQLAAANGIDYPELAGAASENGAHPLAHYLDPAYPADLESKLVIAQKAQMRYEDLKSGMYDKFGGRTLEEIEAANIAHKTPLAPYDEPEWIAKTEDIAALQDQWLNASNYTERLGIVRKMYAAKADDTDPDAEKALFDLKTHAVPLGVAKGAVKEAKDGSLDEILPANAEYLSTDDVAKFVSPDTAPKVKQLLLERAAQHAKDYPDIQQAIANGLEANKVLHASPKEVTADEYAAAVLAHGAAIDTAKLNRWANNANKFTKNGSDVHPISHWPTVYGTQLRKQLGTLGMADLREIAEKTGLDPKLAKLATKAQLQNFIGASANAQNMPVNPHAVASEIADGTSMQYMSHFSTKHLQVAATEAGMSSPGWTPDTPAEDVAKALHAHLKGKYPGYKPKQIDAEVTKLMHAASNTVAQQNAAANAAKAAPPSHTPVAPSVKSNSPSAAQMAKAVAAAKPGIAAPAAMFKSSMLKNMKLLKAAAGLQNDLPSWLPQSAVDQLKLAPSGKPSPGGMHSKDMLADEYGNDWMSKPETGGSASGFRSKAEAGVADLSRTIGMPTVPVYAVQGPNGKWATVQPWVKGATPLSQSDLNSADDAFVDTVVREAPLSMFVGDYDGSEKNWLRTPSHGLVRCDAGQAFKFWGQDKPDSLSYSPNGGYGAASAVHIQLLERAKAGKLSVKVRPDAALPTIKKIESLSDAQLREVLRPTAKAGSMAENKDSVGWWGEMHKRAKKTNGGSEPTPAQVEEAFLDYACERKRTLRAKFRNLCAEAGLDLTAFDADDAPVAAA